MHILSLSLDETIASGEDEALTRQTKYADYFDQYTVIVKTGPGENRGFTDGPLKVIPTNSRNRYTFLVDAYRESVSVSRNDSVDVVTTQDPFALGLVGHLLAHRLDAALHVQVHTDFLNNDVWRTASWEHRIFHALGKRILPRAEAIRVGTEHEMEKLHEYLGETASVDVAPVNIDFEAFDVSTEATVQIRGELDIGDRPIVLFAGRFVSAKDLPRWLKVASMVHKLTDQKPVFVLVGDGPQLETVRTMVENLGLASDIRLPGWVDREKLGAYYATSDIFLITSAYEGTSRVVVEAGVNELPVVATPFAGALDNIEDGETGFVEEDVDSLAQRVAWLLEHPEERTQMGEAARTFLQDRFDPDRLVSEYVRSLRHAAE